MNNIAPELMLAVLAFFGVIITIDDAAHDRDKALPFALFVAMLLTAIVMAVVKLS